MTSRQIGRPREFDIDEALEKAMLLFWEQGFDGASLTSLTEAMGISRKSMYAAFGNKESLFLKALELYAEGPASYGGEALLAPTAFEVARQFLLGASRAATLEGFPTGCLGIRGALAVGESGKAARDTLALWRAETHRSLRDRFQRAVDEGDLPPGSAPDLVARYVLTFANGLAVQAIGGASREDLLRVVDAALQTWPPALT